jgi:hypothetical protein
MELSSLMLHKIMRSIILCVVMVMAVPGFAQAQDGPDPLLSIIQRSEVVARSIYSPECGPVEVVIINIDGRYLGSAGLADRNNCRLIISNDVRSGDPGYICQIVVHEMGHLAGLDHSEDLSDYMYPRVVTRGPECRKLEKGFIFDRNRNVWVPRVN